MAVVVTEGLPVKPRKIGGVTTLDSSGEIVSQVGAVDDTRIHRRKKDKYVNVKITGKDRKHAKDILKDYFPKTADSAQANIAKQDHEQREGEWVRYNNEMKLRLSQEDAARALRHMRRTLPKGPPATRPTFCLGAHIVTAPDGSKQLVRD